MQSQSKRPLVLLAMLLASGCEQSTPLAPPPEVVVDVSRPEEDEVVDYEDFTGRTAAVGSVDIRARVSGYLTKVNFKDGDIVAQEHLLYEIDRRPFEASLDQAKGDVQRLEGEKKLVEVQVDRYRKLAEKGAGSQQDLDQYLGQQAENLGALRAAEAKVALADLNLQFTRIAAPIAGQVSRTVLTPGNLVIADNTLLTTLVSLDPMYAYFSIEEPTLLRVRKLIREGVIRTQEDRKVPVHMGLADDSERKFPLSGTLDFVNNAVDPQTGTILVRGVFANPYELPQRPPVLTPGLFVRVRLAVAPQHKVFLINERAIGTDQGQKYVYVVDAESKVRYRRVKVGLQFRGLQAVEEGLSADDRVVVNGLQRIRPGIEVKTQPVDMTTLAAAAKGPQDTKGRPRE